MKIVKEKFKKNIKDRFYWARVYFISDNREHKTKVIWAASFEWVRRQLLAETWSDADVEKLVNKIIVQKWKNAGRAVFNHKTQYDPWGINDEENAFLRKFAQERSEADRCG